MTEVPVRVAVRVRPLIGQEVVRNVAQCIHVIPEKAQLILGKDRGFTFDHVFPSNTLQNEVYEVCVEPLLKSCFEGYNATVFAYGQTGSGKTYTIGGSNTAGLLEEEYGIVPRAAKQIFQITEERKHKIQYTVRVSYIEIYMEELRDLLELETSSKDIHIREDENGNTIVAGASEQVVNSADEMMSCLDAGSAGRHFGTTNMNEHSSRSHSIFTVYIDQRPIDGSNLEDVESELQERNVNQDFDTSDYVFAKFHFVDLAGSERAHRTGNVGERFKESVFINSGLLALGNVISSLADSKKKVTHIPYRDSKVTRLLKDSLGGNARTVMITCLSPSAGDFAENLNSLKYATRARNIRNKPVINRDPQNARLVEMQNEIQALREELQRHRGSTVSTAAESLNPDRIRFLEEELNSCRSSCEMYKKSALSAAVQLKSLYSTGAMTNSQSSHYERWLKSLEQIKGKSVSAPASNKESRCDVIEQLKQSLNKYKEDLASDEEIFAEKTKEINALTDHIRELQEENSRLDQQLNDAIIRLKRQEDQLFHQQLQLNQQMLKKHNQEERLVVGSSSNEPLHRHRAFSEPVNNEETLPQERKLYTSPPTLITMERIIDGFRARSQLLVSQHEEEDEVNQTLSDTSESEEEEEAEKTGSKVLGRTWNTGTKKRSINSQIPVINRRVKKGKDQANAKVPHPKLQPRQKMETKSESEAMNELRSSTHVIKREVEEAELRLHDAHQKLRDLTMSVRYKEELVSQLVKSEKEAKEMKMQYNEKIKRMKLEVEKAKKDLEETKKALDEVESKANFEISEKQKLENEYKKKLNSVEAKLQALKKKQKDKEKVTTFHEEREKKVQELESHIYRMRNQQEALQRKLKEESENKAKREREMQKHLQKIKELETQTLQQQKLLKRKTEEVAVAQRRLRNVNKQSSEERESEEYSKLEERRRWLDAEVEKVIKRKQAIQALEEELKKREQIVVDKEAMLAERSELEIKKLRSSQVLSKDIMRLSTQLGEVERKIQEKGQHAEDGNGGQQSKMKEDLRSLHRTREELLKQRELLEQKLQEGTLLIPAEERRLIELDEGIEALEAAIEFKNDTITSQREQLEINESLTSETILAENERNSLKARLGSLAPEESVMLLSKYFVKVVELREAERQLQLQCSDMDVRVKEQERIIGELGRGLQQSEIKAERKLMEQQRDYEQKIHFLLHKANESDVDGPNDSRIQELEYKSQQLEKELYYYKKSSRDLKKKLREYIAGTQGESGPVGSSVGSEVEAGKDLAYNVLRIKQSMQEQVVDTPSQASTPVRVSRKDLRQLSAQEIVVKRSQSQSTVVSSNVTAVQEHDSSQQSLNEDSMAASAQDSIETGRNPWR